MSWAEPAARGYHDVGQPEEPSRVLLHQRPRVERSFMLEGLAGQAASTGRRTGSCCCSCCRSAISVGESRWSGPLGLPQCRTAPLHCPSPSRQLFYTVSVPPDSSSTPSQCLQTAPLHCLSASRQFLYTVSRSVCDSSISNPAHRRQVCRGAGWGIREAGWKHE